MAAGLLTALFAALFWDAVFLGRALAPVDFIYTFDPLWHDLAPLGFQGASNPILSDLVDQFYPWRAYIYYWLSRGEIPLWNASILAGSSFVGNGQSALFYPLQVVSYLLPLTSSFTFTALTRLLVAGLSTYAYLRLTGRGVAAAYLGAITFSLSGFMIVWLGYAIVNVAVWLPALVLLLELIFRSRGRRLRWTGLLALVVGVQFLGGHPETSFHILVLAGAYALFLAGRAWVQSSAGTAWRGLLQAGVGVCLGLALGAVQVLPFLEELGKSNLAGERGGLYGSTLFFHPNFGRELASFPTLLFPTALGSPAELLSGHWEFAVFAPCNCLTNYNEWTLYVGTIPLLLAIGAGWVGRRDGRLIFWSAAGLVSLAVAYRLPLFEAINHLPLFDITMNGRLRLVFAFAAATLAAAGLDWLLARLAGRPRGVPPGWWRPTWRAALAGILALAALLGAYLGVIALRQAVLTGSTPPERQLSPTAGLWRQPDVYGWPGLPPPPDRIYLPALAALLLLGLIWLALRGRVGRRLIAVTLPALVAAELLIYGLGYNPTIDPALAFPETSAISFLREHAGTDRIVGMGNILHPNRAMIWGLQDIRAYEIIRLPRTWKLLQQITGLVPYGHGHHLLFADSSSPLLDLLGVRFVLSKPGPGWPAMDEARYRRVYAQTVDPGDGSRLRVSAVVYENLSALPRAYFVGRARVVDDPEEILGQLRSARVSPPPPSAAPGPATAGLPSPAYQPSGYQVYLSLLARDWSNIFDPRSEVLLESEQMPPVEDLDGGRGTVEITSDRPNSVTIRAAVEGHGYLVLSDSYDDGWAAYVDGQSAPIYRANYALRAIRLGPGEHQIDFVYRPRGFILGAALSAGALLGLIGVGAARQVRSTRLRRAKGITLTAPAG